MHELATPPAEQFPGPEPQLSSPVTALPEVMPIAPEDQAEMMHNAMIDSIANERDRDEFRQAMQVLPSESQTPYYHRLLDHVTNPDEVASATGLKGTLFELRNIKKVADSGLEQLDFNASHELGMVTYPAYSKRGRLSAAPDYERTSAIDCDVPIERGDKPYVYEVKDYSRMAYGSRANRNQLLKYQTAVETEVASGASVQVKGRMDPRFIKWAFSGQDGSSPVPNVELLYTLDLPSGQEYTVVLKPGPEGQGLRFKNPEASELSDVDARVVAGLEAAQKDGSLPDIVSTEDYSKVEGIPAEVTPYLANPETIDSVDTLEKYDQVRRVAVYNQLNAKAEA